MSHCHCAQTWNLKNQYRHETSFKICIWDGCQHNQKEYNESHAPQTSTSKLSRVIQIVERIWTQKLCMKVLDSLETWRPYHVKIINIHLLIIEWLIFSSDATGKEWLLISRIRCSRSASYDDPESCWTGLWKSTILFYMHMLSADWKCYLMCILCCLPRFRISCKFRLFRIFSTYYKLNNVFYSPDFEANKLLGSINIPIIPLVVLSTYYFWILTF